jgi:hypothetical protein
MKREVPLPYSQKPATYPYSELYQSNPCLHPTTWRFILILSFHLHQNIPSGLFLSGFPTKTLYTSFLSLKSATFCAHLILLDIFTLVIVYVSTSVQIMLLCPCLLHFSQCDGHVTLTYKPYFIFTSSCQKKKRKKNLTETLEGTERH